MDHETINTLNTLNQVFYQTVGADFDQTRQKPWQGWQELVSWWQQQPPQQIVDVGCGNARLAVFLAELGSFSYFGIDTNKTLLSLAETQLKTTSLNFTLSHFDIVAGLQQNSLAKMLPATTSSNSPTWFTLFGVLHHIPSNKLRQKLLLSLAEAAQPSDSIIISCWQFDQSPNLWNRRVEAEKIGLSAEDLEENDYILDWQRGATGYRYCHLTLPEEVEKIVQEAELQITKHWAADGRQGNLNNYYLLQKKR